MRRYKGCGSPGGSLNHRRGRRHICHSPTPLSNPDGWFPTSGLAEEWPAEAAGYEGIASPSDPRNIGRLLLSTPRRS
jgi:hypothetical protein